MRVRMRARIQVFVQASVDDLVHLALKGRGMQERNRGQCCVLQGCSGLGHAGTEACSREDCNLITYRCPCLHAGLHTCLYTCLHILSAYMFTHNLYTHADTLVYIHAYTHA